MDRKMQPGMKFDNSRTDPAPPAVGSTDIKGNDYQISVRREGHSVEIKLVFSSEYASMAFYDSLAQSAKSDTLCLELKINRS
jgi:hypothetical protein